jgi:LCP family protein required for cell wall assembly
MAVDTHTPIVIAAEAPSVTPGASTEPLPSPTLPVTATFQAQPTARPWDQKGRLNILLVGVDQQDGGFRTDTMIVASIDPTTHRVALFSMPRDTWGLPTPPGSALSLLWGPSLNFKLNALWTYSDPYRGLFPGGGADALKEAMSYALFGTPNAIPYYVLVSFSGFQDIIDTFGGVTINVPAPLVDNGFPGNGDGQHLRVNIPAGMQHMNGFEALTYARSRKGGGYYNDYDRSARQEQLLVALKQQADLSAISSHLSDLIDDLSSTIHTDIPEGPDVLGALIDQARFVNLVNIKTYAFSTSGYGEGAMVGPVDSQTSAFLPDLYTIRATVAAATSPAAKVAPKAVVTEQAPIVVEVGSGTAQQAADLVAYLQYLGLNAEVGAAQPGDDPTKMLVVDGADGVYPQTLAFLEQVLGLAGPVSTDGSTAVQASSQAGQQIEFVIILGANTPDITPPSS